MVPVVSNVKGGWEASVGYDPITGNELSSFDRSISGAGIVFGGFARVPGKVVKYGSEGAEYVLRVNKAEKTVTKHKVKDVSKGESKAVEKVEKPGGKAGVEGVHDQEAVSKGTGETIIKTVNEVDYSDIRAYRDIDIGKVPIEYRADPRLVSEMNYKGKKKSGANAAGWERSASKHFNELLYKHPEFFSEANIERIENGLVPVVDDDFIKYFPQYKDCKGDKLIHHHIGGGGQAAAVPQSLHQGFGGIHNFEKEYKIRDNDPLTEIGEVFTSQKQP